MSEKRLIDANALLEKLDALSEIFRRRGESEDKGFLAVQCGVTFAICEVDEAATIPAEVVRHGRWEHKNNSATCTRIGDFEEWFRCDLCYAEVDQEYPNCPYCTARMDGQGEGDAGEYSDG